KQSHEKRRDKSSSQSWNCLRRSGGVLLSISVGVFGRSTRFQPGINSIRGVDRESGPPPWPLGLVAEADVVLLLPLMRSGGVQSNIHHRGPGRAPEPGGPIR
ncbi:unnamed protein product, partial [Gadus morhua 'NCC']